MKRTRRALASGLCVALLAAAGAASPADPEIPELASYPQPDAVLGEQLHEGEIDDVRDLIHELAGEVRGEFARTGHARRDAHAKAHGCVSARFDVDADLPRQLAHGVLQPGASYRAKVRFSNGTPRAAGKDDDIKGDMRGMAIKLYDVPGPKLFSLPGRESEHDLILISKPYFFFRSTRHYAELFEVIDRGGLALVKLPFLLGVKASYNAWRMLHQRIANPLTTRYWSLVAYQLGAGDKRIAVKYSAIPCGGVHDDPPADPSPNYLREAMVRTLAAGPACMDFLVQARTDPSLSVEDVISEWPEDRAPFRRVGRITVPSQAFDTPAQNADCENESFNPWQALPEHKPLGNINRARRVVYEAESRLRHELNGAAVPQAR